MKSIIFLLPFLIISFLTSAQKSSENLLNKHGERIQKVIKTEEGILRGFEFGDSKKEVKKKEDAKLLLSTDNSLLYEVDMGEGEKADIIYYFNDKKEIYSFGIAFLVKSTESEDNLFRDLSAYYTEKYGDYISDVQGDEIWTAENGRYHVAMSTENSEAGKEIEVEYNLAR